MSSETSFDVDSPFADEVIAEAACDVWEGVEEEINHVQVWLLDPMSKVTRSAMVEKLESIRKRLLESLSNMVKEQDFRLREVAAETQASCEEVLASNDVRIGIRELYAVALRVLEDADLTERDLLDVARQADPLSALRQERVRKQQENARKVRNS